MKAEENSPEALLAALKTDDPFVLAAILRSLKQLRISAASAPALKCLGHADASVRRARNKCG